MTSTEIKTIELIVNSEQAKKRLDELNARLITMKQKREESLTKALLAACKYIPKKSKRLSEKSETPNLAKRQKC
ncbi:MAG: hypothetical protein IJS43_06955 [Bacteroidaceae bacterium]|nr:hypothetical protein [Bacteroidaceae bacterium]